MEFIKGYKAVLPSAMNPCGSSEMPEGEIACMAQRSRAAARDPFYAIFSRILICHTAQCVRMHFLAVSLADAAKKPSEISA